MEGWKRVDEFKESDFPHAEVRPVFVDGKKVDRWIAIVNKSDGYVYNIATKFYKLVNHWDVFSTVAEAIKAYGYEPLVDVSYTKRGARMYAKFIFAELDVAEKDTVNLGVMVKNSYDGSMSVNIGGYGFRVVCANGMVLPLRLFGEYTPHIGTLKERIENMVDGVVENIANLQDILVAATEKKISRLEAIKFIEDLPIAKKRKETLIEMLPKEEEITVWDAYNALTYHFTHEIGKLSEDKAYQPNSIAAKILVVGR